MSSFTLSLLERLVTCGPFDERDHVVRRLDRESMRGHAWPGGNIVGHLVHERGLAVRRASEQGDDDVLERDQPHAKIAILDIADLANY